MPTKINIFIGMPIPICITCSSPLKIKGKIAKFRCMCDDDIRTIPLEIVYHHPHVINLCHEKDAEKLSGLLIKEVLTISEKTIE